MLNSEPVNIPIGGRVWQAELTFFSFFSAIQNNYFRYLKTILNIKIHVRNSSIKNSYSGYQFLFRISKMLLCISEIVIFDIRKIIILDSQNFKYHKLCRTGVLFKGAVQRKTFMV